MENDGLWGRWHRHSSRASDFHRRSTECRQLQVHWLTLGMTVTSNDWGHGHRGNVDGVGASAFAPCMRAGGRYPVVRRASASSPMRTFPSSRPQTIYWTSKREADVSNIDITGYTLNL